MKKKISILGSTGSIGESTLKIVIKDYKNIEINTLIANSNIKKIIQQIRKFKPRNFVITNVNVFNKLKLNYKFKKTKLFNNYEKIRDKNDLTVIAIQGLASLKTTIHFIKKSKKILLANKEAIICGWDIISSVAKKYKSTIIPIDSEHFSIAQLLKNHEHQEVEKIFLTASGGPFLNFTQKQMKKIKIQQALNSSCR